MIRKIIVMLLPIFMVLNSTLLSLSAEEAEGLSMNYIGSEENLIETNVGTLSSENSNETIVEKEEILQEQYSNDGDTQSVQLTASTSSDWAWPTKVHSIRNDWPSYQGGGNHNGTDFGVPVGSNVYATCDGVVHGTYSPYPYNTYGGTNTLGVWVVIKAVVDGTTVYMLYGHLSQIKCSPGDRVEAGQVIALSGNTGYSTGPHMHYEVDTNINTSGYGRGTNMNPRGYLPGSSKRYELNNPIMHSLTLAGNFSGCLTLTNYYESGTVVNLPVKYGMTREGYSFAGWYTDPVGGTRLTSVTMNSNMTLYAHWTLNSYTNNIDHWCTGFLHGEGNNLDKGCYLLKSAYFEKQFGEQFILDGSWAEPIPNGFYLSSSTNTPSISGEWKTYSFPVTVNQKDYGMHFEYVYNPCIYSVSYNMNGGVNNPENPVTYNVLYEVTFKNPTRKGYKFTGWTINGTTVSGINPGCNASFSSVDDLYSQLAKRTTGDVTVTANWKANAYTLDVNGKLNGEIVGNTSSYGKFDVYINGKLDAQGVDDYCKSWPTGTTYEIKNIRPSSGKSFDGFNKNAYDSSTVGSRTGVLNSDTKATLAFHTIPKSIKETPVTKKYNGRTYKFFKTPVTWYEAKLLCERMGGHLVTVTSTGEMNFVKGLIGSVDAWAGGTDRKKEGTWKWVTDESFKYVNWASGEPNDYTKDEEGEEDFLVITSTGAWNDLGGYYTLPFICEIEPDPVPEDPAACRVFGFCSYSGKDYWFEDGKRQAVKGDPKNIWDTVYNIERGREIYDPESDGWYWLDCIYDGAKASNKEVWMPYIFQEDLKTGKNPQGKWVRYDSKGKMIKGWYTVSSTEDRKLYPRQEWNTYYYDLMTGEMVKGWHKIEGKSYHFDEITGVLIK